MEIRGCLFNFHILKIKKIKRLAVGVELVYELLLL